MLFTFSAIYCSVTQKQLRHLYYYFQYVVTEIFCVILIYMPQIFANKLDPCIETVNIVTRALRDVEVHGGKFIMYILPISGHRVPALANLRNLYDTSFPLIYENAASSLGLVMSVGFIVGILVCFFQKEKLSVRLEMYGKFELFFFLVSTVGGLGVIVGLINYSIRCYNRFSFFIGAVGIIISMKLLQEFCMWVTGKISRKYMKEMFSCGMAVFILGVGVFDQTTVGMVYTDETSETIRSRYDNDAKFVEEIENFEGKDANILVFPVMNGQQSAIALTKDGSNTEYNEQMLFLQSNTSNWSTGSKAGEAGERWLNWLQYFDEDIQVKIAAVAGFSGIAVYKGGYKAEQLDGLLTDLEEMLGKPIVVSDNGLWQYYSISRSKDELLAGFSEEEIEELKSKYLYDFKSWRLYSTKNLYTTSEYQDADKIILTKDTCQYGPYNGFDAGLYMVEIYGENLRNGRFDCSSGGISFDINMDECNDDYVKYYVSFETNIDAVEFRTFNESDSEIVVKKIEVNRVSELF